MNITRLENAKGISLVRLCTRLLVRDNPRNECACARKLNEQHARDDDQHAAGRLSRSRHLRRGGVPDGVPDGFLRCCSSPPPPLSQHVLEHTVLASQDLRLLPAQGLLQLRRLKRGAVVAPRQFGL